MVEIANSTFLDFVNWRYSDATTVPEAFDTGTGHIYDPSATETITLGLMVDRAADPTSLLSEDWADRQKALAELGPNVFDTYGGNAASYQAVLNGLAALSITPLDASTGYVSGVDTRTVWVSLTPAQFLSLTGQNLFWTGGTAADPTAQYWEGNLHLPDSWGGLVKGLWVDTFMEPPGAGSSVPVGRDIEAGPQSQGNSTSLSYEAVSHWSSDVARLYNFPLLPDSTLATGIIGLVEPSIGTAMPGSLDFQTLIDRLREAAHVSVGAGYYNVGNTDWDDGGRSGERNLDVGIVSVINAASTIGSYSGPGLDNQSNFTGYMSAVWDTVNNPGVISSSWTDPTSASPDSPFLTAYRELFVDAALRNITIFTDASDGGSGAQVGNGLTNVWQNNLSPYAVVVGGTSLSTPDAARHDPTLASYVTGADDNDRTIIATLVAGGMRALPQDAAAFSAFIETVWNQYYFDRHSDTISPGYIENETGTGGVDITQPVPDYQRQFGLLPHGVGPDSGYGRGIPDVSANAGGNMYYFGPGGTDGVSHDPGYGYFGTSAATPLWASLGVQINAIFADQGLPNLGYMTDLLYQAAVIAPGSFNDVTIGNNISSYYYNDSSSIISNGEHITPTGYGYSAAAGYDLVTGLGTPNGVLLARALTGIAHSEMYSDAPDLADISGGVLHSSRDQSLLVQSVLSDGGDVSVHAGAVGFSGYEDHGDAFAWTRQFAQQAMQADFDTNIVRMFDGLSQVRPHEINATDGAAFSVSFGDTAGTPLQAGFSNPFGFVDYVDSDGHSAVELARPVAVAANAGGNDDQAVVVRLRQAGASDGLSLSFYKVDTLDGAIDGVRPGDANYAVLAAAHSYQFATGGTAVHGPGFGNFTETALMNVDQGDIIAMVLTNTDTGGAPHTYYAFAQANEQVDGAGVAHLWSYGLNTWGWEDLYGGGDHDYNDLVVQLDFTSATGSGVLI